MKRDAVATVRAAQPHCTAPNPTVRARALSLCGQAVQHLGHHGDALRLLREALAVDPSQLDTWRALAEVLTATGHPSQAIQAWEHVAVRTSNEPTPWLKLAALHRERKDLTAAVTAVQQAMLRAPHRADLPATLVTDLLAAERPDEAQAAVLEALTRFPDNVRLHLQAAEGYSLRADRQMCLHHLNTAVDADPRNPRARTRRALFFVQTRQLDAAAADVKATLAIAPNHAAARLQEIRLAVLGNEPERALTLVDDLLQNGKKHEQLTIGRALLYRADIHEKAGRHNDEWRDLSRGQAIFGQIEQERGFDGEAYLRMVQHQTERLRPGSACRTALSQCPTTPPEGSALVGRPPVFMFGFPRSGTTLCERILGAHPNLTSTDELNLLGAVCESIDKECGHTPVEQLSDAQIRHLRQVFAQKAVRAGLNPTTTRLIDKVPLNLVFMDVIRRVFPDAPVLMILRDPRDCIWSSFRQAFEPNQALVLTHDLESTARLYRTAMDCWQQGRTFHTLQITEIHYEHVVSRLEHSARAMVHAAGESWDPAVLDYRSKLGNAFVRTPSFAAVGQKVNKRRIARWMPHKLRIDAILPQIQPYVDAYGVQTVAPELLEAGPFVPSTES